MFSFVHSHSVLISCCLARITHFFSVSFRSTSAAAVAQCQTLCIWESETAPFFFCSVGAFVNFEHKHFWRQQKYIAKWWIFFSRLMIACFTLQYSAFFFEFFCRCWFQTNPAMQVNRWKNHELMKSCWIFFFLFFRKYTSHWWSLFIFRLIPCLQLKYSSIRDALEKYEKIQLNNSFIQKRNEFIFTSFSQKQICFSSCL